MSAEQACDFFSLGSCMDGLDLVCRSLFGVRLRHVTPEPGEVWSSDILKLVTSRLTCVLIVTHHTQLTARYMYFQELEDEREGFLGTVYLDLFERKGKPPKDCHFTIQGGRQTAQEYQVC